MTVGLLSVKAAGVVELLLFLVENLRDFLKSF